MALLDEIKKRLASPPGINQPVGLGAQTGAQAILSTKATGKAATPTAAPRTSAVGQQVAQQQAQQQLEEVGQAAKTEAVMLGQQQNQVTASLESAKADLEAKRQDAEAQQAAQFQSAENARLEAQDQSTAKLTSNEQMNLAQLSSQYNNKVKQLASDRGIATEDIFEQFRQSNLALEDRKDAAQLEQLAFTMRLSDTQYIDNLTRVAKLRGLEDSLNFRKESARLRMGNETALLMDNYKFLNKYDQNSRDFSISMNNMSIEQALNISESLQRDANRQMVASGITEGAKVVANAYSSGAFKTTTTPAPTHEMTPSGRAAGPV
jgi:hypothetical protein